MFSLDKFCATCCQISVITKICCRKKFVKLPNFVKLQINIRSYKDIVLLAMNWKVSRKWIKKMVFETLSNLIFFIRLDDFKKARIAMHLNLNWYRLLLKPKNVVESWLPILAVVKSFHRKKRRKRFIFNFYL